MILYRPVGLEELLLMYRSGMRRFPPRLPEQPIFYPVLILEYADQIAKGWNTKSGSMAGYVTEFDLDDLYGGSFEVRQVGAKEHQELWVPAESLKDFNEHISGQIQLVRAHFGSSFVGPQAACSLRGKDAQAQLVALQGIYAYNLMDLHGEVTANHEVVFANFPYWEQLAEGNQAAKPTLAAIRETWRGAFPAVKLGLQPSRNLGELGRPRSD